MYEDTRRNQIIDFITKELIGPDPLEIQDYIQLNGEEILRTDPPLIKYIAGILYPKETIDNYDDMDEEQPLIFDDNESNNEDLLQHENSEKKYNEDNYLDNIEDILNRSNTYRPSAMSLTIAIKNNDKIRIKVNAGVYSKIVNPNTKYSAWARTQIEWDNNNGILPLPQENEINKVPILNLGLQIDITFRRKEDGYTLYTITLENTNTTQNNPKDEECFFQSNFQLFSELGFHNLPEHKVITSNEDIASNQLLYRNIYNYAIGHGCSAEWDTEEPVKKISTAIFPSYEVKPIVPNLINGISLDMKKFSSEENFKTTISELNLLCDKYEEWIKDLEKKQKTLDEYYSSTAERHITNCKTCLYRMRNGLKLLQENSTVRTAFQYMNLAMLLQQLHYNIPTTNWIQKGMDDIQLEHEIVVPIVQDEETWYGDKLRYGHWRPFQIAFILINLLSMYDKDSYDRNIVDLIWFPTGGGKTEAYLGLSAYTIFLRRLQNKDDKGTAILMRYTLRLLTAQQYERASSLICSCEYIRQNHPELFGKNQISLGLWVGQTTTPNTEADAITHFNKLYKEGHGNPFILLKCPWCGAKMGPIQVKTHYELPGYIKDRIPPRKFVFRFRCKNHNCNFSKTNLPLYIVDEAIYNNPPTMIIGTVDKFAMLPYTPQAQSIFGYSNGVHETAPDLIIQDEIHLISGPLGSMVGIYETLINELCCKEINQKKYYPKIIASTATINSAKEQCHALYGCNKENVFQFPPAGLDAGDSFFALEDKSSNGRKYVGIMSSSSSKESRIQIRLLATLLYAVNKIKVTDENERDPYWTIIGYYNTLRELSQTESWLKSDIPEQLKGIYFRKKEKDSFSSIEKFNEYRRFLNRYEELTSRIEGSDITQSLNNLNIKYTDKSKTDIYSERPIDICLATNMISVGLDISRLGLMTLEGQPKTSSEYIQATSRIGRNFKDAPGLIFVHYNRFRARDKSFYENFTSYHSKLYTNIEPTSVTPFAPPVRDKALHAIIIGMLRLESGKEYNDNKPIIPSRERIEHIKEVIKKRVANIDEDELEDTILNIDKVLEKWEIWNPDIWNTWIPNEKLPLMYSSGMIKNSQWRNQGFPTPTSMRNVDTPCNVELLSNVYTPEED